MKTHEIGLEISLLQHVVTGRKSVEVRLATGKFLLFAPGDELMLRGDVYVAGELVRSQPDIARATITRIGQYDSFRDLLDSVPLSRIAPDASSIDDALATLRRFYSAEAEAQGVLAIYIKPLSPDTR
jgi:ASC-1-like (ASCH) protein